MMIVEEAGKNIQIDMKALARGQKEEGYFKWFLKHAQGMIQLVLSNEE